MRQLFPQAKMMAPCFEGLPCLTQEAELTLPQYVNTTSCATVFAGHYRPGPLLKTLIEIDRGDHGLPECRRDWAELYGSKEIPIEALDGIDCLIAARDPVSRIISHYLHFSRKNPGKGANRTVSELFAEEGASALLQYGGGPVVENWLSMGMQFSNADAAWEVAVEVMRECHTVFEETPPEDVLKWLADVSKLDDIEATVNTRRRNVNAADTNSVRFISEAQILQLVRLPEVKREGAIYAATRSAHGLAPCGHFGCWQGDGTFLGPPIAHAL